MVRPRVTPLGPSELSALLQNPHLHVPRLVISRDTNGTAALDRLADRVSAVVGSMWTFVFVTTGIVVWLFAGNIVGFDRTPWPLSAGDPEPAPALDHDLAAGQREPGPGRQRRARDRVLRDAGRRCRRSTSDSSSLLEGQSKMLASQEEMLSLIQGAVSGGSAGSA